MAGALAHRLGLGLPAQDQGLRSSRARRSSSSRSIVQNAQAVGSSPTDIPYGSTQISRFGVEETVVDGVIFSSSTEEGLERRALHRDLQARNTAHLKGRHNMVIGQGGIAVFPALRDGCSVRPVPALV